MANEGYNAYTPAWESFEKLFPIIENLVSFGSYMAEGSDTFSGIPRLVNAFKFNSGVRPLYEGDSQAMNQLVNMFNQKTAMPSATPFESFARTGLAYLVDDKARADAAIRDVGRITGAGYTSFANPGYTMAESFGTWDRGQYGDHTAALAQTMADVWLSSPDNNVSNGMRQALFVRQMGGDQTVVQANAKARILMREMGIDEGFDERDPEKWARLERDFDNIVESKRNERRRNAEDQLVYEETAGTLTPERRNLLMKQIAGETDEDKKYDESAKALKDFVTTINDAGRHLSEFTAAAADWGKMLKTDADTATTRVSNLLGVDAARAYTGAEFGYMTHMMQNAAQLSGNSTERIMQLAGVAQQQLSANGLSAESSMAIATIASLSSTSSGSRRTTQNSREAADIASYVSLMKSDAGQLALGGFQVFASNFRGSPEEAATAYMQRLENMGGITLGNVQRLTGVRGGLDFFNMQGNGEYAQQLVATHPEFLSTMRSMATRNTIRTELQSQWGFTANGRRVNILSERNRLNQMTQSMAGVSLETVMNSWTPEQRRAGLDEELDQQIRQFDGAYRTALVNVNRSGHLGRPYLNASSDITLNLLDEQVSRETVAKVREAQARSRIQADYTSGGFGRVLYNSIKNNPDVSLGSLFSTATGMTLQADTVKFLSGNGFGKEEREALSDVLSSKEGIENKYDKLFEGSIHRFDQLRKEGVQLDKAIESSGLGKFGFGVNGENLTFNGAGLDKSLKEYADKDKKLKEDTSAEHKEMVEKWSKDIDSDPTTSLGKRYDVAERLTVYDVFKEKVKYKDVYNEEQKNALQKYQDALSGTDEEAIKQAEKTLRNVFKDDKMWNDARARNRSEMGIPNNGGAFEQIMLGYMSKLMQKLFAGENDPIFVQFKGDGGN